MAGRRALRGRSRVELPGLVRDRHGGLRRLGGARRRRADRRGAGALRRGPGRARRSRTPSCGGARPSRRPARWRWARSPSRRCARGCGEPGRRRRRRRRRPRRGHAPRARRPRRHRARAGARRRAASAGASRRGAFAWDSGPSLLTLPQVFEALFEDTGAPLPVPLQRVEPVTRYRFADGSGFDLSRRPTGAFGRGARGVVAGGGRRLAALPRHLRGDVARLDPVPDRPAAVAAAPLRARAAPADLVRVKPWWTLRQLARAHTARPAAADGDRALRDLRGRRPATRARGAGRRGLRRARVRRLAPARRAVRARRGAGRAAATRSAASCGSRPRVRARGARRQWRPTAGFVPADARRGRRRALDAARPLAPARALALRPGADARPARPRRRTRPPRDPLPGRLRRRVRRRLRPPAAGARPDDLRERVPTRRRRRTPRPGSCSSTRPPSATPPTGRAEAERLIDRLGVRDRIVERARRTPARPRARDGRGRRRDLRRARRTAGSARCGGRATRVRGVRGLWLVGGTAHPGGGLPLVALSGEIVADQIGPA